MLGFMQAGGVGMWFVAALGAALVITAIGFARGADPQRLSILRALSLAVTVASLTGFASGLASTCRYVTEHPDALAAPVAPLLAGFAEASANVILGGALLAIAWLLVALGVRRMPA
jgi:ABC-type transport system involved in cytochrome c biogenesis permease subunit